MPTPAKKKIPDGLHTLTPHLAIKDCAKAIEFYKKAFGAEELSRMTMPGSPLVWHASLRIGGSALFVGDEMGGARGASSLGGTAVTLQLNVEDCDALFNRAVAAGAKVKMPLMDMFWGDRYGQLTDPFGNDWAVSTHLLDLTPEEMRVAGEAAAKAMAPK